MEKRLLFSDITDP